MKISVAHAYAKIMQDYHKNITAIVKIYKLNATAWNTKSWCNGKWSLQNLSKHSENNAGLL